MASDNTSYHKLSEALENRILQGISSEWEHASWILEPIHRRSLKKPRFSIRDTSKKLGQWSREKREIMLSRNLVLNHPWDAVVDVLKHEMAHQFADEILNGKNETGHGPSFIKACGLLRANPLASEHYVPLDERIKSGTVNEQDKTMSRVRKLFALAKSQNRHEAETAMAKAQELIEKYNIDLVKSNPERSFESIFIGKPSLRHFREDYHLASLLCDYYFVEGLWANAYVLEKGKMGRVLEISGTETNLAIAIYVYEFITRYIHSEWEKYNSASSLGRYRKTDFAVGLIEGFRKKLDLGQRKEAPKASSTDLVKIEDPRLRNYMIYRYPRVRSFRRTLSNVDPDVLKDGEAAGKKMVISKGISEKKENKGLMISTSK
ncbi:MAG: SprT-like domain-containing protein [Proteobacteria bacterium]|nr:SprT-like domain-containing protein [Pseudomonadota bacterium]